MKNEKNGGPSKVVSCKRMVFKEWFLNDKIDNCFILDDGEPMQATEAVQVLDGVGDNDVETLLGFPLLTKAEPYTARAQVNFIDIRKLLNFLL